MAARNVKFSGWMFEIKDKNGGEISNGAYWASTNALHKIGHTQIIWNSFKLQLHILDILWTAYMDEFIPSIMVVGCKERKLNWESIY